MMTCEEEANYSVETIGCKDMITKKCKKRWRMTAAQQWWSALATLTLLALATRQAFLSQPSGTLWDEVHFGTFANHYINRTFYHDVHPPLGKMAIAGVAYLAGYNGTFDFQMGKLYTHDVNYTAIRSMMAVVGSSLVPLAFLLVWELSNSLSAAVLASICILCDTFLHRLNTLIVLDPLLLASIMAAIYGTIKFHNQRHRTIKKVDLDAGAVLDGFDPSQEPLLVRNVTYVYCKIKFRLALLYEGKFMIVCGEQWQVLPHTVARGAVLILLPVAVYLSSFVIHFWILTKWSVNGGGFYHTKFFAAFDNTEYDSVSFPEYIHFGANITIQSSRPLCGFLESWYDLFPSEWTAPCQQVTTATLRDNATVMWTIKKVDLDAGAVLDGFDPSQEPLLVRNGDYVMLTHSETGRSLRSHGHRAPITKRHFQVCGYGDDGTGGPFETWQLIIAGVEVGEPLAIINQDFMLKHHKMNCFLKANEKVQLPKEWAFNGAKEVTCTKNRDQPGTEWHVNWNNSPKLKKRVSVRKRTVGLWGKIVQQHLNMFIGNSILINMEEEERSARPWMWPTLWQVQVMGSYVVNKTSGEEMYSVGMTNPFLTYLNLLCLLAVPLLTVCHTYFNVRCSNQSSQDIDSRRRTLVTCWWLLLLWATHYVPFFFMSRVLYYHHYCPSYIFSCMITGVLLTWACETVSRWGKEEQRTTLLSALQLISITALLASYTYFFPLATYITGFLFEYNTRLNPGLDAFYFGQMWPEFGYRKNEFETVTSTHVGSWISGHLDNPHINATLYYLTPLNNTGDHLNSIHPIHASNFSLWSPSVISHSDTHWLNPTAVFKDYIDGR
ncbi:protein O-mannosyl-transferase 2-like [Panulirus ornatus]|uniref:protein O-mannosyl-transferase 2-like n=1 Tax=Panulirus ornatus TaxID=150431 RepID=UPI003A84749D